MPTFTSTLLSALCIAGAAIRGVDAAPAVTYYTFAATKVTSLAGYYLTKIDDAQGGPFDEVVINQKSQAGAYTIASNGELIQEKNNLVLTLNPGQQEGQLLLAHSSNVPSKYPQLKCYLGSGNALSCTNNFTLPMQFYVCRDILVGLDYQQGGSNPCPDFCGDGTTTCPTFVGTPC